MNAYISTKEELKDFINRAVSTTVKEELPGAIRKATRKKWLTTEEAMKMLSCSRRHIQHLRDSNQLPYIQNGRVVRYDVDDVEAFLNRNKVEPLK